MGCKFAAWVTIVTLAVVACSRHSFIQIGTPIITPKIEADNNLIGVGQNEDEATPIVVDTEHGPVAGYNLHAGDHIISYFDIPYGKFNLFGEPTLPDAWTELHDVRNQAKYCPQLGPDNEIVGEPDCLTLSVFTPSAQSDTLRSVLIHIHDTDFVHGRANSMDYGPEHLVPKDIVMVLPNYRLGPLGFLCLQNETVPGNAALKDLMWALKWTVKNIEKFGGDPTNIAVSGIGNAGVLAGYLAISPVSHRYISNVITDSGSALSFEALDVNPKIKAEILSENVRKSTGNYGPNNMFINIDIDVLLLAAKGITFKPCIEKVEARSFMTESPWSMLQNLNNTQNFMVGFSNYAGIHDAIQHTELSLTQINENHGALVPRDLAFSSCQRKEEVGNRIKTHYFENNVIGVHIDPLCLYYTDAVYLAPGIRLARALVERGVTVYFYEFSFVGAFNRELHKLTQTFEGAARGDLAGYVFTQNSEMPPEGSIEEHIVNSITNLWATFIKTGTPVLAGIEWNNFMMNEEYLSIGSEIVQTQTLHPERLALWTQLYTDHFVETNDAPTLFSTIILSALMPACLFIFKVLS